MNQKFVPNFTTVPNIILDEWMPLLSAPEFKIVILIARKTYGWHKDSDDISTAQIAKLTDLGRTTVVNAVNRMEEAGFLTCTTHPNEKGKPTPPNTYRLNLDFGLNTPTPYPADGHPPIHLRDSPYAGNGHSPIPEMDTQKKPIQNKQYKEKKESAEVSMEADANAQSVASLSSDFDAVSNQATEEAEAEVGLREPSGYKPRGRASTTRQERAAIEALYRAFEAEYRAALLGPPLKENDEISKHLEVLLAAYRAGKTLGDMARATVAAVHAYANTDFAVTVASVCRNFLYKQNQTRQVAQTEDAPRRITNAERFRQMAENGGMPEL